MRIAFITAGAAGMFCGSCMRDNTLAAALLRRGHDAVLVPTYTPIRTDEEDVSQHRVFFGGINVYLQQHAWLFRHTPWLFDRVLDLPRLLRFVSPLAQRTKYSKLGGMAVSMLRGRDGKQRKEVEKLTQWLAADVKPEVVLFTNALLSGIVPEIKRSLGVPILVTLQGDDIFLDALPEPDRSHCIELIRQNSESADAFIATSRDYADQMAEYLGIPRERIHVVWPGINVRGNSESRSVRRDEPFTIGYFARICPEKGFHIAVDAFIRLRQTPGSPKCRLRASGWLGDNNRTFFHEQIEKLRNAGLLSDFEYVDCPDHAAKMAFMQSLDVLTVPTVYREPKGLYVLEAWENGVPTVLPAHGTFPELIEASGAGVLVPPNDPAALAASLLELLTDPTRRENMGQRGIEAVRKHFSSDVLAEETLRVLNRYVNPEPKLTAIEH